jgi:multidrug resistance efflux pump
MAWIGGTAVFVLVVTFGQWELKISRQSQVFASSRAQIRAAVDGTIREIFADEGDTVLSGSLIARLDDAPYRSDMLETAAEIEKRTAELTLLEKGPLDEEVRRLQSLVERENTRVSFAEREFERVSELRRKNLVSSAEFEGAKEQLELCRKDLDHARSDLDVLLTGTRPEQIESARAEIERLEVTHDFLEEQVARTDIVSPITGVVSTHHLRDRVGEYLEVGDELCRIVNPRTMLLEIPVSEKDVAHVDVGQRVKFRARSIPELAFHGRVTEIAPEASRNDDHTVFVVTSEVDNPDAILRPGMTGNAKIYCGRRRIVYLWTRQIIKFIRVEFWL